MRKVNIKRLRDNLSKELKDLPLSATSDGQVVATILTLEQYNKLVKGYGQKVATSIIKKPLLDANGHIIPEVV